ncbi:hypothetical protein JY651_09910 [Pyxidicoccus parkwayensis]|uniref:Transporter n=1 Tax=Pyxidicoccus parkwayensis TaxID=2813578 RepID=A0ABX7P447_9BACT|nr:hypothetical protein [Pyxidicoccus parkwaysis]QSQ25216.1 hypothetical protein JY651_09910 [Pyxidicoccus parkwaysis]
MERPAIRWARNIAAVLERALALAILAAVIVFAWKSVRVMWPMDWGSTDTLYEAIYRVLLLVIGVELARTLVTHDMVAILELLAFVIARKMLKPDLPALDILLSTLGFFLLLIARRFLTWPEERPQPPESGGTKGGAPSG